MSDPHETSDSNPAPRAAAAGVSGVPPAMVDGPRLDGIIGASAALFDAEGRVLLIQRGKPPFIGVWSLPGGHIEPGEAPVATARREVGEEAGVAVAEIGFLTRYDVPVRDPSGHLERTLGLAVFYGRVADGAVATAAGDASAARFVALPDLETYALTENCAELVQLAARRLSNHLR